jgi:hypothetical protein
MPGFLDSLRQMQFNRTFANAGQPYNDMLGRYGNQLPPSPVPVQCLTTWATASLMA